MARIPLCISGLNKKLVFDRLSKYSLRVQEQNRSGLQSTAHAFSIIWLTTLSDQTQELEAPYQTVS